MAAPDSTVRLPASSLPLIEQFLRQHTNRRDDEWGGSLQGRLRFALAVVQACLEEGLLLVPAGGQVVRFVPPLTIKPRQLRQAVQLLERALLRLAR